MSKPDFEWNANMDLAKIEVYEDAIRVGDNLLELGYYIDNIRKDMLKLEFPKVVEKKLDDEFTSYMKSVKVIRDVHTKRLINILELLPERPDLLGDIL